MKKYIILDTEMTRDFCESLIGTIGTYKSSSEDKVTSVGTIQYIHLETLDGELVFKPEELEEIQ